jgi:hypothetical protein
MTDNDRTAGIRFLHISRMRYILDVRDRVWMFSHGCVNAEVKQGRGSLAVTILINLEVMTCTLKADYLWINTES